MSLVHAENLFKDYQAGDLTVPAIRGVDFSISSGSFVCFVGPSGSGKTTLLNMIGCLDRPSRGELSVLGTRVSDLDRQKAAAFRGENLTAYENIEFPLIMVQHWSAQQRRDRVKSLLAAAGIEEQADKRPDQLSGGQKQRVAVARALVTNPKLVLADEPTANLDHDTAYRIINLMRSLRDEFGTSFVFSTHDPKIMGEAEVTFELEDGLLHPHGKEYKKEDSND